MFWWLLIGVIIFLVHILYIRPHNYWKRHNVPQGNLFFIMWYNFMTFFQFMSFGGMLGQVYKLAHGKRYAGAYQISQRALIIKDPTLIKNITVKDFDHFTDHNLFFPNYEGDLWNINLLALKVHILYIRPHNYWKRHNVPQGNLFFIMWYNFMTFFQFMSFGGMLGQVYKLAHGKRYAGAYQISQRALIIKDPTLIKNITVKDFDHFTDHNLFFPNYEGDLWNINLLALKGAQWKDMRATLSPAFTTSKMKGMATLVTECAENFAKHFEKINENIIEIEMKDTVSKYTNDVIASVAFGVKCDSFANPENEFFRAGKTANSFDFWKTLKLILCLIFPPLIKFVDGGFFSKETSTFFRKVIKENIEFREKNNVVRPDMLHLLLEARKNGDKLDDSNSEIEEDSEEFIGQKVTLSDDDITAQALIFFVAGFDSTSLLICFLSYELAINPDIQEKLKKEIFDTIEKCENVLTYEHLMHMKYLDMVISETLRKWPNAVSMDRQVTKPYTIKPESPSEKPVQLKEKEIVWIPILAIHRDPENYADPEVFDPERFSDKNKNNIKPYTYFPFGTGPRNCIGSRFALLEAKIFMFNLLSKFQIVPIEKTEIPLQISPQGFSLNAKNGFWLGLKRLNN